MGVKDVRMEEQEASQRKEKRMQELRKELQTPKKKKFMTPERKKKLRQLLMREAAKQLKIEQEKKAERRKVIGERTGAGRNLEGATDQQLKEICNLYHKRIFSLESEKFDLERDVQVKDININELNIAVNDLKGKYVKPTLKKVSKYENKFAK